MHRRDSDDSGAFSNVSDAGTLLSNQNVFFFLNDWIKLFIHIRCSISCPRWGGESSYRDERKCWETRRSRERKSGTLINWPINSGRTTQVWRKQVLSSRSRDSTSSRSTLGTAIVRAICWITKTPSWCIRVNSRSRWKFCHCEQPRVRWERKLGAYVGRPRRTMGHSLLLCALALTINVGVMWETLNNWFLILTLDSVVII